MTKGSMVVLKADRRNNLYYLKGSTVTGQVAASTSSDEDSTRLWHMRLGHAGEKSLQTLARQGLLKGVGTCKMEFCEHCIIGKKTKVKFDTATRCTEGILDMFTLMSGDLPRLHHLEVIITLCLLLMTILGGAGYIP